MKEQELKKAVMPFAQMRMKETNVLGPDVSKAPFEHWLMMIMTHDWGLFLTWSWLPTKLPDFLPHLFSQARLMTHSGLEPARVAKLPLELC